MLEEADQQPSININFLPVSQLVKINHFSGQYLQGETLKKPA